MPFKLILCAESAHSINNISTADVVIQSNAELKKKQNLTVYNLSLALFRYNHHHHHHYHFYDYTIAASGYY
jgi:hypothetical protein